MLEILISSSALILVLAILRLVLRDKISARLQYALWLLVLVRLLVPVSFFRSPVSVAEAAAPVTEQMETISKTEISTGPISQLTANRFMRFGVFPDASEPTYDLETPMIWSWSMKSVALLVWRVGTAVMAVWFLFVNLRLLHRLKKSRTPYDAAAKPPVYVAGGIPSPCLFGLIDPIIYLTEQAAADPAQARQIVAHEKTHLRHGDLVWALLRCVCLAVWWFNPLVWLAASLSRQDCELACDEGTIQALGENARFDYGRTLVGMAKVGAKPSDLLCSATTMTTGKKSLKARVERIAKAPKTSTFLIGLTLVIAAIAVGCTYAGSVDRPAPIEPEVAAEAPSSASAADAEGQKLGVSVLWFDPDSGEILSLFSDFEDAEELYGFYLELCDAAIPTEESDVFPVEGAVYSVRFHRDDDFSTVPEAYVDASFPGFTVRDDGTFLVSLEIGGDISSAVIRDEDGTLIERFMSILDEYGYTDAFLYQVQGPDFSGIDPELLDFFNEYASVVADTVDFETWANYLYFENDYSRQLAQDASLPFGEASILGAEQVNGDLAAFLVLYGRDTYPCLQFVGRYDGRLYVFRNKDAIPEELREGLDAMTLPDPAEGNDNIMAVDTFYWDEVEKELGSFARSSDIEVFVAESFDEAIPADSIFGPMTLEDYIYGTDGWKFEYDGPQLANGPEASIIVRDADGRALWIMDDADALMIEEADGSITWVTYAGDPVDCADMIRHLLPWARGEYPSGLTDLSITHEGVDITSYTGSAGTTIDLDAVFAPIDYVFRTLVWTSSDETVASVDDEGRVTLLAPGQCFITVWIDNLPAECEIIVQ